MMLEKTQLWIHNQGYHSVSKKIKTNEALMILSQYVFDMNQGKDFNISDDEATSFLFEEKIRSKSYRTTACKSWSI